MERRIELVRLTTAQIEQAMHQVMPDISVTGHRLLDGGRANTNYVADTTRGRYVLRIHTRDRALCVKERAIHALVAPVVPVASFVGMGDTALAHPFSVLEFVAGDTLEHVLQQNDGQRVLAAARSLGHSLAGLTTVQFDRCGDLIADVHGNAIVQPWHFTDFYYACLFESPAGARLGSLKHRLWSFLQKTREKFGDALPIHLVHGDFNPSNLLVRDDGEVAAILDWEFAHAGKLWMDLGNLLRHRPEAELPEEFAREVAAGLADCGVILPADWRERSELEDLASACEFLSSAEERPIAHARAIEQIRQTLERWDGLRG